MDNLIIWNKVREVPKTAMKEIVGGRLKGMTDINPVWRLKILTEQFGICGFGWRYEILDERLEDAANNEISAFVKINLYIKVDGEWSAPIPGTGGSSFVASEKSGLRTSDECFKMALTDAISVACKALGIGADVYWNKDSSKYDTLPQQNQTNSQPVQNNKSVSTNTGLTDKQITRAFAIARDKGIDENGVKKWIQTAFKKTSIKELTKPEYDQLCAALENPKKAV